MKKYVFHVWVKNSEATLIRTTVATSFEQSKSFFQGRVVSQERIREAHPEAKIGITV